MVVPEDPKANLQRPRAGDHREPDGGLTLLLVDPRAWSREALAGALQRAGRNVRVLRLGATTELAQFNSNSAAAVILLNLTGIGLADPRAASAAATALSCQPDLPVVALSDNDDPEEILGT